jgi:hypothetical protein
MKTYVCCLISIFIILGFSGQGLAVDDNIDENFGPVDLVSANAEIYERADGAIRLKLSVKSSPHLPGAVLFECDVDDSAATGGNMGMLGAPVVPCPCKVTSGLDVTIALFMREQGDTSSSAYCSGCADHQGSCAKKRRTGQWYAMATLNGQPDRAMGFLHGLLDPLPREPDSGETEDAYTLPWDQILQYAHEELQGNPKRFNYERALDLANNKWQVSIWYDSDYSDQDDMLSGTFPAYSFDVSDWMPDVGTADMQAANAMTYCEGNFDNDQDVDGTDAGLFKSNFGRSEFINPCPACNPN